jgi:hypothetical protein
MSLKRTASRQVFQAHHFIGAPAQYLNGIWRAHRRGDHNPVGTLRTNRLARRLGRRPGDKPIVDDQRQPPGDRNFVGAHDDKGGLATVAGQVLPLLRRRSPHRSARSVPARHRRSPAPHPRRWHRRPIRTGTAPRACALSARQAAPAAPWRPRRLPAPRRVAGPIRRHPGRGMTPDIGPIDVRHPHDRGAIACH